jgi:hypothetical protein
LADHYLVAEFFMSGFALALLSTMCIAQLEDGSYRDSSSVYGPGYKWDWQALRAPAPWSPTRTNDKRSLAGDKTPGKFYGPGTAVRRDISTLSDDSPTLQSYRKAIQAMKSLPANDPHNWNFWANIHGSPGPNQDPSWDQCQHGNWWFLPWHRAYLHYFERIIRRYAEDPNFALPYWDYSNPQARALPAAFRDPTSALYEGTRRVQVNNGTDRLNEAIVVERANRSLAYTVFADTGSVTTFGGQALNAPQHFTTPHGAVEAAPHDLVHGFIGGNFGDANTAARDPIFYLHHANIDRLWVTWLAMGQGRANPSNETWLNQQFSFYDENKQRVTISMRQVQDIASLGYSYDRSAGPTTAPTRPAEQTPVQTIATWQTKGIPLQNRPATLVLTIPERSLGAAKSRPRRFHLEMNEVQFAGAPDSTVDVYINLPPKTPVPGPRSPQCAGCFTFFGHDHHGKGLVSRLEVTNLLQPLLDGPAAGSRQFHVTLMRVSAGVVQQEFQAPCTFNSLTLSATK